MGKLNSDGYGGKFNDDPSVKVEANIFKFMAIMVTKYLFDALGMRIFLLGLRGINPHFSHNDKT